MAVNDYWIIRRIVISELLYSRFIVIIMLILLSIFHSVMEKISKM